MIRTAQAPVKGKPGRPPPGKTPFNLRNHKAIELGRDNLAAVREWMAAHLCGTQTECAKALGLSPMAVNRHVNAVRAEWRDKP